MNVLVINCGSSSLKFAVYDTRKEIEIAAGHFDSLGSATPKANLCCGKPDKRETQTMPGGASHSDALEILVDFLNRQFGGELQIDAVGHRVVHGGENFQESTSINETTLEEIDRCSVLAPLHNPANALGIRKAREYFPDVEHVAVFDTAFHQTLAKEAFLYAIPYELYEKHGIRRYGFHGTSHKYVSQEAARILKKDPSETNLVTVHLGNGCSATAIKSGKSVETSMGLTPLEGLVMGTRSGDLDPGIIFHLHRALGLSIGEIDTILNKQSGLLGLSTTSNDMRSLREAASKGDEKADLAIRIFVKRLAKTISGLRASLDDLDAIVFTGGIGENDSKTRSETLSKIKFLGIEIDEDANQVAGKNSSGIISAATSKVAAIVIPTREELMIARETEKTLAQ